MTILVVAKTLKLLIIHSCMLDRSSSVRMNVFALCVLIGHNVFMFALTNHVEVSDSLTTSSHFHVEGNP